MRNVFDKIEQFLRFDELTSKSGFMRARAVYMMGLAFIATQLINLAAMYYTYGLSFDHLVSVMACGLVLITIVYLRSHKRFETYALIYSVLIVLGTMSSAMNQNTGINSALLPFFVLGIIVNGFICGWRATCAFGAFSLLIIWMLWGLSLNYDYTPIFDVEKFADRNFQRAMQASLASILITMVGAFFSKNMHEAFDELEAGITAAQESDRAKTDFLATMSHELFTPMNGIIGMNDVLEDTNLDEEQRELTTIIRDSGRDLQMIVGNVLLFAQLDAGRVKLDDEPFNIGAVLKETVQPYAAIAAKKGLAFKARMAPNVPKMLIGDEVRTGQIICTLLNNAIKFTDKGAVELTVKSQIDSQGRIQLIVIVTDTGIGIAPENIERMFERFTQQDGSIKRRHGGIGLGLTIASGLIDLMDGKITVDSEVGVGSSFTVVLTYAVPETDRAKTQTAQYQAAAE